MTKNGKVKEPVLIKKYANRRLYNTENSIYITLEDVRIMVRKGEDFVVQDAKTGEDLTRQILTQIIFEQEMTEKNVMPIGFLKKVIELYDDKISEFIPHYLESSMEAFVNNQEKMRSMLGKTWTGYPPITKLEEISRQNVALINQTLKMFNPFDSYFNAKNAAEAEKDAKDDGAKAADKPAGERRKPK